MPSREGFRYLDFYAQVKKPERDWYSTYPLRLLGTTKGPPTRRTPGSILLPVRLWVPSDAFEISMLEVDVPLRNIDSVYQ